MEILDGNVDRKMQYFGGPVDPEPSRAQSGAWIG